MRTSLFILYSHTRERWLLAKYVPEFSHFSALLVPVSAIFHWAYIKGLLVLSYLGLILAWDQ